MIIVRRADERFHERKARRDLWSTFNTEALVVSGAVTRGFGILERLDEVILPPSGLVPRHLERDAEVLTFAWEGSVAHEDSLGGSAVLHAGEFQRLTTGRGVRHTNSNASRTEWAHLFQLGLSPSEFEREPGHEERRFSAAQRRDGLCVIASFDGRCGSLLLHEAVVVYSAVLDPGHHVVLELAPGRTAWLHVVTGKVAYDGTTLDTGDGAGASAERSVSITSRGASEVLLIDLPAHREPLEA